MLSTKQVAQKLNVTVPTVRKMTKYKVDPLPFEKQLLYPHKYWKIEVDGSVYEKSASWKRVFDEQAVEEWLERHKKRGKADEIHKAESR